MHTIHSQIIKFKVYSIDRIGESDKLLCISSLDFSVKYSTNWAFFFLIRLKSYALT